MLQCRSRRLAVAAGIVLLGIWIGGAQAAPLAAASVRASHAAPAYSADGVIEAVRQTVVSSQVAGAIVQLPVKAGDAVRAGQLLLRIDARAASQAASASRAQVEAAHATLAAARRDVERQKQLFTQHYISQASLDKAESQFREASAQARALLEQAGAAQTQSGYFTLLAPYAGVVADVQAMPGDMAMPGRPLLTLYDPEAMRAAVTVPQQSVAALAAGAPVALEVAGQRQLLASKVTVLPMADPSTHTVQLWLELAAGTRGLVPGMFVRARLPQAAPAGAALDHLYVPASAVFQRAELSAVYVLDADGKPMLRQVRPGPLVGPEREILSGVAAGERVAVDPLAAAAWSRP